MRASAGERTTVDRAVGGDAPRSEGAERAMQSSHVSGKTPEVLRGRESEVGLGGPWSVGGAAELSHPGATYPTFPTELPDARITMDTVGMCL